MDDSKERIVCAACRLTFPDHIGYGLGINHGAIIGMLSWYRETFHCTTEYIKQSDQCFLAWSKSKGYFIVDRLEAYIIAEKADQLLAKSSSKSLDSYRCAFDKEHWPRRAYISFEGKK